MRSRSTLRVIVAAVAVPLLVACVAYYYFLALMGGLLTVPTLYAARIAAGDGGHLTIRGVGETGFRAKGSDWNVRYASAGGERTEDVGAWFGRQPEFVAGQAAGRLVFAALPDRLFVRTARGAWKEFSLRSVEMWESEGIHVGGVTKLRAALALGEDQPLPAGWVVHVSADPEEIVVDLGVPGIVAAGRLYFHVSGDGERLELVRVQAPTTP
jgi:hypothetical protein